MNPLSSNHHHYSTITTSYTFRHDAARQSAYHRLPFPNHKPHQQQAHGHQDAKAATGTVTFYNGLFTQQFVASGTVYTGQDGVAIVTTQDATIPPGNPGTGYGHSNRSSPSSHSRNKRQYPSRRYQLSRSITGYWYEIINFHNGQDERTYTTVTQKDIHSISTVLKTTLAHSITGALQGQLTPQEQLQLIALYANCYQRSPARRGSNTGQSNRISKHAAQLHITARNYKQKQQHFLLPRHNTKAGAGYSLFGTVQVSVKQASVTSTTPHLVFLSFHASGTWIYGLTHTAQEQIKHLIAGKTTQQADNAFSIIARSRASLNPVEWFRR